MDGSWNAVTITSAIIVLLVFLLIVGLCVAIFFRKLTNTDYALALPQGSVRAIIALLLIVIFVILSVHVYTQSSQGRIETYDGLTAEAVDALRAEPSYLVLDDRQGDDGQRTVTVISYGGPLAGDIGKQLVTLLGTLITAVASFYFGSRTVARARGEDGTPNQQQPGQTIQPTGGQQ
jgi:amino acid transporter